ncbi:ABC transporter ATP-binding protein [Fusobacterium perfoetens]|uniref:ABC transporter ATP-binding protein n=1 Tax=Fusobacterium perfoetens TaxID=852 RepID=UPI001F3AC4DC|nr:ABC transporter ATP-binding protein [Fusobacterium perfoetens]MCF2626391.1 ABC transporter ATP-binding protein [Fusobacterium perfoetens]
MLNKKNKKENIIIKYYKKEKSLLFAFIFFNIAVTVLDLSAPLVVKNIIDKAIPDKNIQNLVLLTFFALFLYSVRTFFAVMSFSRGQLMGNRIKYHMRNDLFSHFLKQSHEFFNKKETGDLIARITSDLESSAVLLYRGLQDLLASGGSLLGGFILMFIYSPLLACITFLPLPIGLIFVYRKNKKMKKGYREIRRKNSSLTVVLHEILRVILFFKDNLLEKTAYKKFLQANDELLAAEKRNFLNVGIFMAGVTFYVHFTQLILIGAGGILFIKGKISIGIIVSFLLLVDRFKVSLIKLAGLTDTYHKGRAGIVRLEEMLESDFTLPEGNGKIDEEFKNLRFQNVSFSYEKDIPVIKNLTFEIKKGEKTAVVGRSGVGKTTLMNLIKRNYLPDTGDIFINGKNYKDINRESVLSFMGTIEQKENILGDTVKNNIKIVRENSTEEEIEEACKKACIHNTIEKLNEKYETVLGNSGTILSTGQQQRISLARVFLKNPEIIILDEATSGLDNTSESKIMQNIDTQFEGKTLIAVTHRLAVTRNFDKIIVIGKEGVIEEGTYDELVSKEGEFYNILKGK